MHGEALIKKRFEDLADKAGKVENSVSSVGANRLKRVDAKIFSEWATSALSLLRRVFGEDSVHYQSFEKSWEKRSSLPSFRRCLGVFNAAREDYEGGYIFDVRALVKADTLDDVLEQALALNNANYVDGACILAGVALEIAVKEICTREGVLMGKFSAMNQELRNRDVYNKAKWRQLQAWYDKRSAPAHGNFGQTKPQEAQRMIEGIRDFIADYL